MSTIKNLNEFLSERGCGNDPSEWACSFYKYHDCGPWVVFYQLDEEAHEVKHAAIHGKIRKKGGKAVLINGHDLTQDFISFLGFDKHGISRKDRVWDTYLGLLDEFVADEEKQERTGRELVLSDRTEDSVTATLPAWVEKVEVTHKEITVNDMRDQYEWRVETCPCVGNDEMETPNCETCGGEKRHRVWRKTGDGVTLDPETCVGIKFGSIVEGSDAESGPFEFMFPFEMEAFDDAIETMEAETSFYWERDNSTWYTLRTPTKEYWFHVNWDGAVWDGDKPNKTLREKVEKFAERAEEEIAEMPGTWDCPKPEWKPTTIPGTRSTLHSYENDTTY